jgi:hypothetical protein
MVPSLAIVMPRGLSNPVPTVVHAAGRNEGLAAGLALELSDGALDGDALDPLG